MTCLRAPLLLSLLVPSLALPACGLGKVCIGDCELEGENSETSTSDASTSDVSVSSTYPTTDPPDGTSSTGVADDTTSAGDSTGGDACELAVEDAFDPLDGCGDGTQNPREFCFVEGAVVSAFADLTSALPVFVDAGGVDVAVTRGDRTASVMLDGPESFLDTARVDWPMQLPEGAMILTGAGDVDEDGVQDVVALNTSTVPGEHVVYSFTLAGDGNLKGVINQAFADVRFGPEVVDWNEDDHLDLVIVVDADPSVIVLAGDGTGNYTVTPEPIALVGDLQQLALGALDADASENDIVAARADGDIAVAVDGVVSVVPGPSGATYRALAVVRVDNDDLGDFVALYDDPADERAKLGVFRRQAAGADPTFAFSAYDVLCGATTMAIGDIDGDGQVDVVAAGPGSPRVTMRRGDGDGGFAEAVVFEFPHPADRVFIADLDGNGANDVLALDLAGSSLHYATNTP